MKRNCLFVLLMVFGLITFIPVKVMAQENTFWSFPLVDYRFFVENEEGEALEDLQFKLYDLNNTMSFDSKYDSNTGAYYFVGGVNANPNPDEVDESEFMKLPTIPGSFKKELEDLTIIFDGVQDFLVKWNQKLPELKEKYNGIDLIGEGEGNGKILQLNIPMVLEEVKHSGDALPIKKIVFAPAYILPLPDSGNRILYVLFFNLMNNTCPYQKVSEIPEENQALVDGITKVIFLTRSQILDYSEKLMKDNSTRLVSSSEIHGGEYFNKAFSHDKFPPLYSESMSGYSVFDEVKNMNNMSNISTSISPEKVVQLSSSNNIEEASFDDYCNYLPVIIQKKEKPSIINPPTFNNKVVLLGLSFFMIGGGAVGLFKMKKKLK